MQVWSNGEDMFVASSPEECTKLWEANIGQPPYDENEYSPWRVMPDEQVLEIKNDDTGLIETKTVREWLADWLADANPQPGLLCTVNF